jgi:hypothetical protein
MSGKKKASENGLNLFAINVSIEMPRRVSADKKRWSNVGHVTQHCLCGEDGGDSL